MIDVKFKHYGSDSIVFECQVHQIPAVGEHVSFEGPEATLDDNVVVQVRHYVQLAHVGRAHTAELIVAPEETYKKVRESGRI